MTERTGACRCGAIRFTLEGEPASVRACHCDDCRKASGAPFSVFVEYGETDIRFDGKAPNEFASKTAMRTFCSECGSPIAYRDTQLPGRSFILIGALDDPQGLKASEHAFVRSKLDDVIIPDGVRCHATFSVERPFEG